MKNNVAITAVPPAAGVMAGAGGNGDGEVSRNVVCPHLRKIIECWPQIPEKACESLCGLVCIFKDAASE